MGASFVIEVLSTLGLWEGGLPLENERRKASCFNAVSGGVDGVLNKGKLGSDLMKLRCDVALVVIVALIALMLRPKFSFLADSSDSHDRVQILPDLFV